MSIYFIHTDNKHTLICLRSRLAAWLTTGLGRRSLACGLFLICARSMVDRWPICG